MRRAMMAAAAALTLVAGSANAAPLFYSTFENVDGGPSFGAYTNVGTADGWTGGEFGIELQNHVAGDPAPTGGNVFVELDSTANSSMFRTLSAAGTYTLSFLYSARPTIAANSNGIDVLLNGNIIYSVTGAGGSATSWNAQTTTFAAPANSVLTFAATGISDSLGGYIDNIGVSATPEPGTWALMIAGVGMAGAALRTSRRRRGAALVA